MNLEILPTRQNMRSSTQEHSFELIESPRFPVVRHGLVLDESAEKLDPNIEDIKVNTQKKYKEIYTDIIDAISSNLNIKLINKNSTFSEPKIREDGLFIDFDPIKIQYNKNAYNVKFCFTACRRNTRSKIQTRVNLDSGEPPDDSEQIFIDAEKISLSTLSAARAIYEIILNQCVDSFILTSLRYRLRALGVSSRVILPLRRMVLSRRSVSEMLAQADTRNALVSLIRCHDPAWARFEPSQIDKFNGRMRALEARLVAYQVSDELKGVMLSYFQKINGTNGDLVGDGVIGCVVGEEPERKYEYISSATHRLTAQLIYDYARKF